MKLPIVNLASDPFVNARPVRRVSILLWVLGCVLFLANAAAYWRYYSGSGDMRDRLIEAERAVSEEQKWMVELDQQLATLDLEWENEQVGFLNLEIAARTFSWSELFDRLVEAMPNDVRLLRLDPQFAAERSRTGRSRADRSRSRTDEILLEIDGTAASDEQVLEFVDRFFGHPSFRHPNLSSETEREGSHGFQLSVVYQPGAPPLAETATDKTSTQPADPGEAVVEPEDRPAPATPRKARVEPQRPSAVPVESAAAPQPRVTPPAAATSDAAGGKRVWGGRPADGFQPPSPEERKRLIEEQRQRASERASERQAPPQSFEELFDQFEEEFGKELQDDGDGFEDEDGGGR